VHGLRGHGASGVSAERRCGADAAGEGGQPLVGGGRAIQPHRRRFERQGILVEEQALDRAEQECVADEESRVRRRERDEQLRASEDSEPQARMAEEIVRLFPGCPPARAQSIAGHASLRGSGRVGRSSAGRALEPDALELAVAAAVRHEDTRYDELLMSGVARELARAQVRDEVLRVLDGWRQ
jgi:hypothetical protein